MALKQYYRNEVVPALVKQFGYNNAMRVPRVSKVVLNMGLGEAVADKKILETAANDLELISGQKVVVTNTRKSIAGFKIREGWPIGCKVTLRGERMYEFLERLVGIAIPRIRDFRGLSPKSFDGHGNFSMGVSEQIIFPEIDYDKIDKLRGLDITIATTAANDDEGRALLTQLRFPFRSMPQQEADDAASSKKPPVAPPEPDTSEGEETAPAAGADAAPAEQAAPAVDAAPTEQATPAPADAAPAEQTTSTAADAAPAEQKEDS